MIRIRTRQSAPPSRPQPGLLGTRSAHPAGTRWWGLLGAIPLALGVLTLNAGCSSAAGHGHGHGHGPLGHRFENAEEWAARFDDPARDEWQRPVETVELLGMAGGMTVADVGAGTGYFMPHLSRAVGPTGVVLAVDIEPDMVRYLKERAAREGLTNVEPRLASPSDPTLASASVDRILIVNTWHHIPERADYAAALARALRPGGVLAVVDYTLEAPHGPPQKERLAPETVIAELQQGGFEAELATESLPHQYVVFGRVPPH